MQKKVVKGTLNMGIATAMRQNSIVKQDLSGEFQRQSYMDIRNKIVDLSKKSGLRKLNALTVAKEVRKLLLKRDTGFQFEEFKAVAIPQIEKKTKSSITSQIYEITLREIFNIFDTDKSGTVDKTELANCLAVMCGGSMTEKINAAFILFDENNSGTMSYDELVLLIKTVLNLVHHTLRLNIEKGKDYGDNDTFEKCDFD